MAISICILAVLGGFQLRNIIIYGLESCPIVLDKNIAAYVRDANMLSAAVDEEFNASRSPEAGYQKPKLKKGKS